MTVPETALSLRRALVAAHKANGGPLSEAQWLAIAEKELSAALPTVKRAKTAYISSEIGLSDDQWLADLGSHPALTGLNVRQEVESCRLWSASRGVKPSRRRIVNWMLKAVADRPLRAPGQGQFAGTAPNRPQTVEQEPMGWRQEFDQFTGVHLPWHEIDATSRAHIVRQMAELAKKEA